MAPTQLLGRKSVATTTICTHMLNHGSAGVQAPADRLEGGGDGINPDRENPRARSRPTSWRLVGLPSVRQIRIAPAATPPQLQLARPQCLASRSGGKGWRIMRAGSAVATVL